MASVKEQNPAYFHSGKAEGLRASFVRHLSGLRDGSQVQGCRGWRAVLAPEEVGSSACSSGLGTQAQVAPPQPVPSHPAIGWRQSVQTALVGHCRQWLGSELSAGACKPKVKAAAEAVHG